MPGWGRGAWVAAHALWIALSAGYFAHGFATYSGLYRLFAEWQIAIVGRYAVHLTALVPWLLLSAPSLSVLGRRYRERQSAAAVEAGRCAVRPAPSRGAFLVMAGLAASLALVSAIAFLIGRNQAISAGAVPVVVDLATLGSAEPPGGLVSIIGRVRADRVLTIATESRSRVEVRAFAPIEREVSAPEASGTRIFAERTTTRSVHETPVRTVFLPGPMTGILVRNGLPPEIAVRYRERGVPVTDPHYVLEPAWRSNETAYVVGGVSGLVALILALAIPATWIGVRLRRRRTPA